MNEPARFDKIEDFPALIAALEASGFFTSFRPEVEDGLLVCVSNRDANGRLHGNSFLVLRRQRQWSITTWGGSVEYFVPPEQNILEVCLECLAVSVTPIAEIPEATVRKFDLRKIATEDPE